MGRLDLSQLTDLLTATIDANLSRDALNAPMNPQYVSSLPVVSDRKQQFLLDLVKHSDAGTLMDGTVPLRQWLETARTLASPRPQAALFQEYLGFLDGADPPALRGAPLVSAGAPPRPSGRAALGERARLAGALLAGAMAALAAMFAASAFGQTATDTEQLRECRNRLMRVLALSEKSTTDADSLRRTVQTEGGVCLQILKGATRE